LNDSWTRSCRVWHDYGFSSGKGEEHSVYVEGAGNEYTTVVHLADVSGVKKSNGVSQRAILCKDPHQSRDDVLAEVGSTYARLVALYQVELLYPSHSVPVM
jgi:hypothetical protein